MSDLHVTGPGTISLKPLFTIDDVEFVISVQDDDFSQIDKQFDDPETVEWIKDQWRSGNNWAWCEITITAKYKGFTGKDYLCGSSYESEQAFIDANDYYPDMKARAFENLVKNMQEQFIELVPCFVITIEKA